MQDQDYPWSDADKRYKQSVMLKIPEHEYRMLKWLAGTTYNASQNGIAVDAIRKAIIERMKEKGLTVSIGDDGTLTMPTKAKEES
jgi:hypothetical protein